MYTCSRIPLPDEKIYAVTIAVVVSVTISIEAIISFPSSEVISIDITVPIKVTINKISWGVEVNGARKVSPLIDIGCQRRGDEET